MTYTTFSGERKDFNKIDHQHLSNIYWFNKIINERDDWFLNPILKRFENEFNGEILPYRPHPDFKQEIDWLEELGYLNWQDKEKTTAKITFEGKEVGEYKSKLFVRNEKIDNLLNE
jgi:hypothetical protein